jgi:hypothetical protein
LPRCPTGSAARRLPRQSPRSETVMVTRRVIDAVPGPLWPYNPTGPGPAAG